jgi:AraC family transcriptional regulator
VERATASVSSLALLRPTPSPPSRFRGLLFFFSPSSPRWVPESWFTPTAHAHLNVWDGERTLTPRIVLARQHLAARGLHLRFDTEQVQAPTDWCCFDDSRHLIYVHRQGNLRSMETGLDWGPMGTRPPDVGDIWVVPAGQRCASVVQGGEPAGFCEISIPTQAVGGAALMPRVRKRDPLVYQLTEGLANLIGRDDGMSRLLKDSLAETLRLHIVDSCMVARPKPRITPRRDVLDAATQSALFEFVEDGLDSEITLKALADLAGMSVTRFVKAFATAFHATPYQFLLDRRIDRAKSQLLRTSLTIAEISTAVGFSTPGHFATAFKHRVGVSPSAYRRSV